MNYTEAFICIAPDSAASEGLIPSAKGGRKTIAVLEYELLSANPYVYTQEELQFEVHLKRLSISAREAQRNRDALWDEFFSKSRACLRASPLPRKYGWGLHFDKQGRIALVEVGTPEYRKFSESKRLKVMSALRSQRAK